MFTILAEDGKARSGILKTAHGEVKTPSFMPVATKGAVKLMPKENLIEIGAESIISNAFILSLKPGIEMIKKAGGLHKFINWKRSIFTDCGGFQVLSMENSHHVGTSMKGIEFKSPFDGKKCILTPKKVMEIQNSLSSDVAMALDHMPLFGCSKDDAKISMKNTHKWMKECRELHNNDQQLLFGIAQGSVYPELRKESTRYIDSLDFDGIAFGGLAVGEPKDKMFRMIKISSENCSKEKMRYVMGVGCPTDIVEAVKMGIDTFDSIFPTRNARHAHVFTWNGPINIDNSEFKEDLSKIDEKCNCVVCKNYTRAYIHHLFKTRELNAKVLCTYHNSFFMQELMRKIRESIKNNQFDEFSEDFIRRYGK